MGRNCGSRGGGLEARQARRLRQRSIDKLSGGHSNGWRWRAPEHAHKILLLDEPLAALDLKLRQQNAGRFAAHPCRHRGGTFIFVTHDQGEAFALANRVVVMNAGRVEQLGTPQQVYRTPASLFVANFVARHRSSGANAAKRHGGRLPPDHRSKAKAPMDR